MRVIESQKCIVCEKFKGKRHIVATIEDSHCCDTCVEEHDGPGKFEGMHDEELGECLILYQWSNDGCDEYMAQEGWGYCAMFGKYLLYESDQGFVTYEEFATVEKAQKHYDDLYADGWGYSEEDAVISERGDVYFGRDKLNVWPPRHTDEISYRRKLARIRLEMMRTGFWPNVWQETHYGVRLITGI